MHNGYEWSLPWRSMKEVMEEAALFRKQISMCNKCEKKIKNPYIQTTQGEMVNIDYEVHLIVPTSKGGAYSIENKEILCKECSLSNRLRPIGARIPNHLYSDLIDWRKKNMPESTVSEIIHLCIAEKFRGNRKNPNDEMIRDLKKQVAQLESKFVEMQANTKLYKTMENFFRKKEYQDSFNK
jgi:hypothetical protein